MPAYTTDKTAVESLCIRAQNFCWMCKGRPCLFFLLLQWPEPPSHSEVPGT